MPKAKRSTRTRWMAPPHVDRGWPFHRMPRDRPIGAPQRTVFPTEPYPYRRRWRNLYFPTQAQIVDRTEQNAAREQPTNENGPFPHLNINRDRAEHELWLQRIAAERLQRARRVARQLHEQTQIQNEIWAEWRRTEQPRRRSYVAQANSVRR